ncbi:MAG: hypothetical protein K8F91_20060 [Candidatus Obscuribacterales bacterium]|nr:hypothetical protein [Candidatus Obscuribacterales bacterium]
MWDSVHHTSTRLLKIVTLCLLCLSLGIAGCFAADNSKQPVLENIEQPQAAADPESSPFPNAKKVAGAVPESTLASPETGGALESSFPSPEMNDATKSSSRLLQGKTERSHIVLEDQQLYKVAMGAIDKKNYTSAVRYLQMLTPELDKPGYEPLLAQCMYYEAGCHKNLNRMNAAFDMYDKAYELFAKYDSSNPLKGAAWKEYELLRAMKGKMDSSPLQGSVNSSMLQAKINQRNIALELQKAQFAINPNVTLHSKAADVILRCNDQEILPKIVKECFAGMSCLETAEIGSNVSNALDRWMPLKVSGATAAFAVSDRAMPTFRATVNGRSYLFDVSLPGLTPGLRKVLVLTNLQIICAVDVDTYDTWLLRMKRTRDGRVVAARWSKLTHQKEFKDKTQPSIFDQKFGPKTDDFDW